MKILHLANHLRLDRLFPPAFVAALREIGDFESIEHAGALSAEERARRIRESDVLITGWDCAAVPASVAEIPGRLRYICHLTGTMVEAVPLAVIEAGVLVTNWGDAPAAGVAEGAMALLLACLKNLRTHIEDKAAGGWKAATATAGTLRGLRLGLYGYGVIARRFHDLCRPFGPVVTVFDPHVGTLPPDARRATTLEELFAASDAVAIHAGLTDATRRSVTAALLARLPDHGIVINTARGDIVDQEALFAELARGRLRAGLDVLAEPDTLPPDHPARRWPNLLLTGHQIGGGDWPPNANALGTLHEIALDNLRRFAAGEPVRFRMTPERYRLST